jgi:hypothetical protein
LFRLSASSPHPFGGEPLVGHADLNVITAGPAPVPGSLSITPNASSYFYEPKYLQALDWTAEDTPISYMFSYKIGLSAAFPVRIDLRVESFVSPSQHVQCMKVGAAEDNYNVEITLTVTSNFGASTTMSQLYKSLSHSQNGQQLTAYNDVLDLAETVDAQTASVIMNCVDIDNVIASSGTCDGRSKDGSQSSGVCQNECTLNGFGRSENWCYTTASTGASADWCWCNTATANVAPQATEIYLLLGDGHCADTSGHSTNRYVGTKTSSGGSLSEGLCRAQCDAESACIAYFWEESCAANCECVIYGPTLSASPNEFWTFFGGPAIGITRQWPRKSRGSAR